MTDEDRYTRITLRIPKDLHQVLSDTAEATSKSLNAEIVGRLQAAVAEDEQFPQRPIGARPLRDELLHAVLTLSALRSEKAVYELRLDLAATTKHQITGLAEMGERMTQINAQIASCEQRIERFKAEAGDAEKPGTGKRAGRGKEK